MDFKNLEKISKNAIFKKMHKNSTLCQIQLFGVFKSVRRACNNLHFQFHKHYTETPFFFKVIDFCIFNLKELWSKRQLFQNIAKLLPIKMHINSFQFY